MNEVAAKLRIAPKTVYSLTQSGYLTAQRIGAGPRPRLRFRASDIDKLMKGASKQRASTKRHKDALAELHASGIGTRGN